MRQEHPQTWVKLPSGTPIRCDIQLADFLHRLNGSINPVAASLFSCQGSLKRVNTSAYVLIGSRSEEWVATTARLLQVKLDAPLRVIGDYRRMKPKRPHILIETSYMSAEHIIEEHGEEVAHFFLGSSLETMYRLNVRWRPEQFAKVSAAFDTAFGEN